MIEGSVLAAVSGGADSTAMLHMLLEAGCGVTAAHYNHGLRESAGGDESFVRAMCLRLNIPFVSERGNVAKGSGVEARARELRYSFFERVRAERGIGCIATGHTADDNAETVLLNLTRGAGLQGLCGIPPSRSNIVRPILHLSRAEILDYLDKRGIAHREDESNGDTVYRRNHIRHAVIPALKEINPSLTCAVTRLTSSLREDEDYLMSLASEEIKRHGSAFPAKTLTGLPRPVAVRVCRLLAGGSEGYAPERIHIDAMLDIAAGGNGRRRNISSGLTVLKKNGMIYIELTKNTKGGGRHAPRLGEDTDL
jgi:tRNA(Ile)-lysidine synthase